jgi:NADH/NAD ratio-sensing transcriptional regulator Rex
VTVGTALNRRLVEPTLITLARAVAGWVAVHTARIRQDFSEFGEDRR